MRSITKFEANDGSEWNTAEKALERDTLLVVCKDIDYLLKPRPFNDGFDGYIQQDREAVMDYKRRCLSIAKRYCGDDAVWDMKPEDVHPRSIAGRFIDDSDCEPLRLSVASVDVYGRQVPRI
jgi:hypothetical protein